MPRTQSKAIPQVEAIASLGPEGRLLVNEHARQYLAAGKGTTFRVKLGREVLLTTARAAGATPLEASGSRLILTGEVLSRLRLVKGNSVAMIQRGGALALKRMTVTEAHGEWAAVTDYETPTELQRVAQTNPWPEDALPELEARVGHWKLRSDVRAFLAGRGSFEAWAARKLLGAREESHRKRLLADRTSSQQTDGSWDGCLVRTARALRELCELGAGPRDAAVRKAVAWLLGRAESDANPGMFFLTDRLVAVQADILDRRRRTKVRGLYFRKRDRREMAEAASADDLWRTACGPRIMWPNAVALEALLAAGCEKDPRVQRALDSLQRGNWCECGFQNGCATRPDRIDEWEAQWRAEFRFGGIAGTEMLAKKEIHWGDGPRMPRIAHTRTNGRDAYTLRMPTHIQPCELVTARALTGVTDRKMRRRLTAQLYRLAAVQTPPDGRIARDRPDRYFSETISLTALDASGRYDLPVTRFVLLRALPWLANAQNADGSWGAEEASRDAATLAAVRALRRVGLT